MFSYNVKIRKQFSLQFPLSFPFLKKHCTNPLGVVRRSKSSKGGAPEARARYWGIIRMWGCPPRVEGYWNVCTLCVWCYTYMYYKDIKNVENKWIPIIQFNNVLTYTDEAPRNLFLIPFPLFPHRGIYCSEFSISLNRNWLYEKYSIN